MPPKSKGGDIAPLRTLAPGEVLLVGMILGALVNCDMAESHRSRTPYSFEVLQHLERCVSQDPTRRVHAMRELLVLLTKIAISKDELDRPAMKK